MQTYNSIRQELMKVLNEEEKILSRFSRILEEHGLTDKDIVIEFKFYEKTQTTDAPNQQAALLSLPLAANLEQVSFTLCPSPKCVPPKVG